MSSTDRNRGIAGLGVALALAAPRLGLPTAKAKPAPKS